MVSLRTEQYENIIRDGDRYRLNMMVVLIVLDINIPTFNGFCFLKIIRNKSKVPVIIVSARSEEGE